MLSLFTITAFSALKVSDINVRMPFKLHGQRSPRYTITAFHPNAKWENRDPDLVKIIENPKNRFNSSITVEVKHEGPRSEAAVLIAQVQNGKTTEDVQVTIYIDEVKSCVITTTARVLYVNSSIDLFTLTGFDVAGNTFTTIDSYKVDWIFNSSEIRRVPVNETDLYESEELAANKILVQGMVLGGRPLGAIINEKIEAPAISLDIVEPIYLVPSEYSMLPKSHFTPKLCSRNGGSRGGNPDKCIKVMKIPDPNFLFTSDDESVATVSSNGRIDANNTGSIQIRVIDQVMPLNRAQMRINVVNPSRIVIPEQYILIGQKPSCADAKFYDARGRELTDIPDDIKWELTKEYEEVGRHIIKATAFNTTTSFVVHTCEVPKFNPSSVILVKGQSGYKPVIVGGSSHFTYTVSDEEVIKYSKFTGKISAIKEGETVLVAHDEKLKLDAKLTVYVEEMYMPRFEFNDREFLAGEKIDYTFKTSTKSGEQFTYLEPYSVQSNDQSVVRSESNTLTAVSQGFANITCKITGYEETILIGVFQHVQVRTLITFNVNENPDLNKRFGPLQWPGMDKPIPSVVCGNTNAKIIDESTLSINDKYKGQCTFSIQNKPTKENPNPRKDSINFTVMATKIVDLAVVLRDELSENHNESGLIGSGINPFESLEITEIRIPAIHPIVFDVYAFANDEKFESIGAFEDPSMSITDQDGNQIYNKTLITKPTILTLTPPPTIDVPEKRVKIIPVHNISTTEFVSIYRYSEKGLEYEIFNGTGEYVIKEGNNANITDTNLVIYPAELIPEMSRTITVADKYIPEYTFTVSVYTEEPAKLEIEGENYCIVDTEAEFTVHVFSLQGNEIQADSLHFTTETENLRQISPTKWVYSSKYAEQVNIIISTRGAIGSKKIDVLDQIKFSPDNMTLFVNERVKPIVLGGGVYNELKFESTNESIVNFNDNILQAINPGYVNITAIVPDHPKLGIANLTVRVLNITGVKIERFPEQPYVDSYIHLIPFLETDAGLQSPRTISWSVEGCNNWEKQYDGSLILRADRVGDITVRCNTHELSEIITIPVDGRLKFATPTKLNLPIGSNYTVKLATELSGVQYTVQCAADCNNNGLTINENGHIETSVEGQYIVVARFKSQVAVTIITVSRPAAVFLQSIGTSSVQPNLLDNDGQVYDAANKVEFTFNVTSQYMSNNGTYTFLIEEPTFIAVNAFNEFFNVVNTTLLSNTLISPQSPVLIKGVETEFVCAAKRPSWYSANEAAVKISEEGKATAVKRGRATVYCTDDILTPVTVTEVQGIQLVKKDAGDDKMYKLFDIVPIFIGGKYDHKKVHYPKDLKIVCNWTAPDCGRAYAVATDNETHHTLANAGCQIDLFNGRRCPSSAILNAYAISGDSEIVHDEIVIDLGVNIWGIPSQINATVTEKQPNVTIPIRTELNGDNVRIIDGSVGLRTQFTENGLEITVDFKGFKDKGTIHIEYIGEDTHKGERMEINVFKGDTNTISFKKEESKSLLDRLLFNSSILLTCVFGFYAAYLLGQSGNLPALSPYKGRTERRH
jgi:hypothetical protein